MRARSPHPSGPYGDHLQYSTGQGRPHLNPRTQQTKPSVEAKISSYSFNYFTLQHDLSQCETCQTIAKNIKYLIPLLQISKSDQKMGLSVFAANSRPLNPAEHQMFWQPFFCDLHGNYIPLYKHKNTSSTMCCVMAGQSHQCMGMNSKASLNEFNMNCK